MNKLFKFSEPHFPNGFRSFSRIQWECNSLKCSIRDRLLIMIAMEMCIGSNMIVHINLLFSTFTPSVISKLFSHTTNLRQKWEISLLIFPQTLLQLSNKPVRSYPVSLQKEHCLSLRELKESKQPNQTNAAMSIAQADTLDSVCRLDSI